MNSRCAGSPVRCLVPSTRSVGGTVESVRQRRSRERHSMKTPSVARIAVTNGITYAVGIIVAFVQAPFLIGSLGDARYGTWALIGQVMGYYGLFDLGTRGAVGYFVARARAGEDERALREVAATAFWMLAGIAVIVLAIGSVLVGVFPTLFDVAPAVRSDALRALSIALLVTALTLPLDVFAAIVNGCRRAELITAAESVARVTVMLTLFAIVPRLNRLDVLAGITTISKVCMWLYAWRTARRLEPRASILIADVRRARLREVASYGLTTLGLSLSLMLIDRIDGVVIGAVLGTASVTFFVIGQSLTVYLAQGVFSVTLAFTPFFAHLSGIDDAGRSRELFFAGTRASSLVAGLIAGGLIAFGRAFLSLWVGDRYVTGLWTDRSDVVMLLLLLATLPKLLLSTGHQYLFGTNQHGKLARVQWAEAVTKLIGTIALVRPLGIAGAAIASVIPSVLVHSWIVPRILSKAFGISHRELVLRGQSPGVVALVVTAAAGSLVQSVLPADSWVHLAIGVAATTSVAAMVVWYGALTRAERARIAGALEASRLLRR
jgi:O-antigen/teichoic acid export membrane protein